MPLNLSFNPDDLAKEYLDFHLAAFFENKLIGILLLKPINDRLIKMRQVAIHAEFQGKGVGKQLVAFSEELAKAKGYHEIELHARESAIPFYLAMNYQMVGDVFLEVNIPHKKMIKAI
jgi:predicted GNAT family N-acyltransferase